MVNEKKADRLYYLYRILAALLFVVLFLPAANPARICGLVNRSTSLLTSGFSYGTLIANFGRAFRKGWVLESTMHILNISSLLCCVGVFGCAAGACLSLGNHRCRRLGNIISIIGSTMSVLMMAGMYIAYTQVAATVSRRKLNLHFRRASGRF